MKTSILLKAAALSLLACTAMAQETNTPPPAMFEAATLIIEGKSKTDGTIAVEVSPASGNSKAVSVSVLSKTKAKRIAEDLWKELKIAAGDNYKVKQSGKKITIKKVGKNGPNFSLQVTGNVAGTSVLIK